MAPTGKRVLLLERGDYLPRERDNWDSTAVFVKGKYRAPEFWYDRDGDEFPPEVNYYVGGNTKFYGAALFRLRPEDFGEIRHHGGLSPAWPLGYDDLEPYYTQAEHLYQVHGRHGEDRPAVRRAWTTHTRRCSTGAHPAAERRPGEEGLHPFHLPIGVRLTQDAHGRAAHDSVCIRCDRVDGFPCPVDGKADAQVICVDPALARREPHLVTDAHVRELETDPGGRTVAAVVTEFGGQTVRFNADIVVLACGAVNTAELLLRSAADSHPDGLATAPVSWAARHAANNLAMMAMSKEPNPTVFQKTLAFDDWYLVPTTGTTPSAASRCSASPTPSRSGRTPRAGRARSGRDAVRCSPTTPSTSGCAARTAGAGEPRHPRRRRPDPPRPGPEQQRRGTLPAGHHLQDGSARWAWSRSTCCTTASTCTRACRSGRPRTRRHGALRHRPVSSALDVRCKAHDVDNLYVVDTSFFPSIGAVNPSLTAIANALRVGDRVTERSDDPAGSTERTPIMSTERVGALVIFGATGDLAKLETSPHSWAWSIGASWTCR